MHQASSKACYFGVEFWVDGMVNQYHEKLFNYQSVVVTALQWVYSRGLKRNQSNEYLVLTLKM